MLALQLKLRMEGMKPPLHSRLLFSGGYHTCKLNSIIHQVIELIELAVEPPVKQNLILANKRRPFCGQDLGAFFEVVDIVHAEKRQTRVSLSIVLYHLVR